MVEVFVHPRAPLVRRECAEEGMRVLRTLRFPALVKLPNANFELLLFSMKISRIGEYKFLVSGAVPGKRFFVAIDGPDERSDQPAQQDARPHQPAGSEIERRRTMGHHLGDVHFAPLALGCRLKLVDSRDHFANCIGLKQIFHADRFRPRQIVAAESWRMIAFDLGWPAHDIPLVTSVTPVLTRVSNGPNRLA